MEPKRASPRQVTLHGDDVPTIDPKPQATDAKTSTVNENSKNKSETAEDDVDLSDINPFSFRKPKDAAAGLSSGLKNVGKGVLGGAATMIYAPCNIFARFCIVWLNV